MTESSHVILVIENPEQNAERVQDITRTLENATHAYDVVVLADSPTILDCLRQQSSFSQRSRPSLILLNLNLTGLDGHTLLAEIKQDPNLRRIPIILFTPSTNPDLVLQSYVLHGNCYVISPERPEQLIQTIQNIEEFWFKIATLPSR